MLLARTNLAPASPKDKSPGRNRVETGTLLWATKRQAEEKEMCANWSSGPGGGLTNLG